MGRREKRTERIVTAVCLIGMLLSGYVFLYGFKGLSTHSGELSNEALGRVTYLENDTRFRSVKSFDWSEASVNQEIRIGDSVFAGKKSQVHVQIKGNGRVTVGEESLVVFNIIQNENLANLINGNFRLAFHGKVKIAVQGEVLELEGNKADLQLFIAEGGTPQLVLLNGNAKFKMASGRSSDMKRAVVERLGEPARQVALASIPFTPKKGASVLSSADYTWRFADLYELSGTQLRRKDQPSEISLPTRLRWQNFSNDESVEIEVASSEDFEDRRLYNGSNGSVEIDKVFVGNTFWRRKSDLSSEFATNVHSVRPQFREKLNPVVTVKVPDWELAHGKAQPSFEFKTIEIATGFVVEISHDPNFDIRVTAMNWVEGPRFKVPITSEGIYFIRARAVASSSELSAWSEPYQFNISKPQTRNLVRSRKSNTKSRTKKERVELAQKPTVAKRNTASQDVIEGSQSKKSMPSMSVKVPLTSKMNSDFDGSRISVFGYLWTMQSGQQYRRQTEAPIASGTGLSVLKWWESSGFEGFMKTMLLPLNSSGQHLGAGALELRYHRRFHSPFPFGLTHRMRHSFFGGLEFYRSGGGNFTSRYDLLKAGWATHFPWRDRWSAGGELVGGFTTGASTKFEVSGFINYYLSRDWVLGIGYRTHFFEAREKGEAPYGQMPYREGYTEGFTNINYYF